MDARVTPQQVRRSGITGLTADSVKALAEEGKTVVLVSRAASLPSGAIELSVAPEILLETDLLATVKSTSNLLLLHTDLMGTIGTISIQPRVEQTAYGIFIDLVDIARTI
jgi:homoserine dehydrogenase